ncbi:30S ribosomal protein S3 [Candidatus Phytoplasma pini]|uniref:Small ribosomal subunit protein uS3 n=1 Tax=Candidatus Phytoplasma pini TaxID=267362 RepID=A0A559KJP4_9MOLU|nr:30S ribosomal protein S3 [Candidatus Phytoplasma pini]TVY12353.1 ribosomal protein S3 [Candidatus Phytoplasma pini]
MGQKSNPIGLRLGIIHDWKSKWYSTNKQVPSLIYEDFRLRNLIKKHYPRGTISQINIERLKKQNSEQIEINLFTSKIGIIQGPENKSKNVLIKKVEDLIQKKININVFEVKTFDKIASLVAQNIALQLQQRAFFRMVQKTAAFKALKSGAQGVKIIISGRLGGSEIARKETIFLKLVPLNTFRADVDYAFEEAYTTYGVLGVKVWIYHGEVLPGKTIDDTRQFFSSKYDKYENKKNFFQRNSNQNIKKVISRTETKR